MSGSHLGGGGDLRNFQKEIEVSYFNIKDIQIGIIFFTWVDRPFSIFVLANLKCDYGVGDSQMYKWGI